MNENIVNPDIAMELEGKYPGLMEHIHQLSPEFYQDGEKWCCLSGYNPAQGVVGYGSTQKDALDDWARSLLKLKV